MKIIRQLSRAFAPFALAALATSAVASAQVTGSASGQWLKVSPNATTVRAVLGDEKGEHAFVLDAKLIGKGSYGQIIGKMEELPIKGAADDGKHMIYDVCGDFADFGGGVIYVQAQILLDLAPFGGKNMVPVGVLDGMLLDTAVAGGKPVASKADAELMPTGKFIAEWRLF